MKEKILISACLLGVNCKYDGTNNENIELINRLKNKELIPFCPEVFGGLTTPRKPAEINNGKIYNTDFKDVTIEFYRGAEETLKLCQKLNIKKAILKSKSPSCGIGKIYDGTFKGILIDGEGITANLLKNNGIEVINEKDYLKKTSI